MINKFYTWILNNRTYTYVALRTLVLIGLLSATWGTEAFAWVISGSIVDSVLGFFAAEALSFEYRKLAMEASKIYQDGLVELKSQYDDSLSNVASMYESAKQAVKDGI